MPRGNSSCFHIRNWKRSVSGHYNCNRISVVSTMMRVFADSLKCRGICCCTCTGVAKLGSATNSFCNVRIHREKVRLKIATDTEKVCEAACICMAVRCPANTMNITILCFPVFIAGKVRISGHHKIQVVRKDGLRGEASIIQHILGSFHII